MSTNVPLVSNLPSSGKSSYATYISADETMFSIALGGFEDVPDESNFKANISMGITAGKPVARKPSLIKLNPETGTDCKQRKRAAVETEREGVRRGRCDSPILRKKNRKSFVMTSLRLTRSIRAVKLEGPCLG